MDASPSPFHADELVAQARAGSGAHGAGIRSFMPDHHRAFFEQLRYLFVATADAEGWPLATMLIGTPGFVYSPDPVTLRVDALQDGQDPAAAMLGEGREVGILGLDLSTRRRNRANGQIASVDDGGFTVAVRQSFGNCAKYIQRRAPHRVPPASGGVDALDGLDAEARALIAQADTLFVASRSRPEIGAGGGLDVSHRGGRPGFVRVEGDTLVIPDFAGNRFYNTLGNLLGEPRAALLFVDFATGDLLQLQGLATIDWSPDAARPVAGAERAWRFAVTRGWRRRAAIAFRWSFLDYSPATLGTGTWDGARAA
jgi:predicted pyridoxine 5'-phosphate oxidase superfamily flavin-nucleotide-binding protein